MRRVFKWLQKGLLGVFWLAGLFLLAAFGTSVMTVPAEKMNCTPVEEVFLQHSLVHADIVIPANSLSEKTRAEIPLPQNPEYYVFGMGDRDIYLNTPTWGELKLRYALKALFLPSKSAMHVEPAYRRSDDWVSVKVCEEQRDKLENFVMARFARDYNGNVQIIDGFTYTGYDRFYEATGKYTALKTCNDWTNSGMKAAGLETSIWSPFPQGVIYHARRHRSPMSNTAVLTNGSAE